MPRAGKSTVDDSVWLAASDDRYTGKYTCIICKDNKWRKKNDRASHEDSQRHRQNLRPAPRNLVVDPPASSAVHVRISELVQDIIANPHPLPLMSTPLQAGTQFASQPPLQPLDASDSYDLPDTNNGPSDAPEAVHFNIPSSEQYMRQVGLTLDRLLHDDDIALFESDEEDPENESLPEIVDEPSYGEPSGSTRPRGFQADPESAKHYLPWGDRAACIVDILMNLPRSCFSEKQLEIILWSYKELGLKDTPTLNTMKGLQQSLQNLVGIKTHRYQGALDHVYYVNDLGQIIAQELANPLIREHLHFYPEDAGDTLEEPWQADRWLQELDPDQLTPMIRLGTRQHPVDYFIWEPTLIRSHAGGYGACIPERWFMRGKEYYAWAFPMQPVVTDTGTGWLILENQRCIVKASDFELPFPRFRQGYTQYGVPDPQCIYGVRKTDGGSVEPWTRSLVNKWRIKAKGSRVVGFQMWLYCDDTSGNVSKKWNKHNSFLFTAAGLPKELSSQEYNVHFLCTSNIAPPLEMVDGIIDQLDTAQDDGIWAWDVLLKERVLVIPGILAMLGDNPMQSELACHAGMRAKYFCRVCWVKGPDTKKQKKGEETATNLDDESEDEDGYESGTSQVSGATSVASKAGQDQPKETMSAMVERALRFMKIDRLRSRIETLQHLQSHFVYARELGGKTALVNARRNTGLKDQFQDFFIRKLFSSHAKLNGLEARQALNEAIYSLPHDIQDTLSPVWRIKGLDPHKDTPVEILHVVLLGFVKYFWRDAMARLSDEKKELLITRLESLDVKALGLSPLQGKTLVKYAGSLTGRDFRVIAQVAPFVLEGLGLPEACYESWLALSALVPRIWQRTIPNKREYLKSIEEAVAHFLNCVARWTPRWFNKPKFHVLVHIVDHIRRFGPAMLFATEAFESFNAVIRSKSVHSNRQAPSRDIAKSFAQASRLRHLLSGGAFLIDTQVPGVGGQRSGEFVESRMENGERRDLVYRSVGQNALELGQSKTVQSYIGIHLLDRSSYGLCKLSNTTATPWGLTKSAPLIPSPFPIIPPEDTVFKICKTITLLNGDVCMAGSHVLINGNGGEEKWLGRIVEILQVAGSADANRCQASCITIEKFVVNGIARNYKMPRLSGTKTYTQVNIQNILCGLHVVHNCSQNRCQPEGSRRVYQEREETQHTRREIRHLNPEDIVLNTGRMRDAVYITPFQIAPVPLNREMAVQEGASKEIPASSRNQSSSGAKNTRVQELRGRRGSYMET